MAAGGSPEYVMTWSDWDMPSGPPICALRASPRRTSGKDCFGWPTPRTPTGGPESAERKKELGRQDSGGGDLQAAALMAGWPTPMAGTPATENYNEAGNTDSSRKTVELVSGWTTPQAHDGTARGKGQKEKHGTKHGCADLDRDASLVGWASPAGRDWKDTPGMATEGTNPDGSIRSRLDQLPRQAALEGWGTPTAQNARHAEFSQAEQKRDPNNLHNQAQLSGWPTPDTESGGHTSRGGDRRDEPLMGGIVRGLAPESSSAAMGSTEGFLLNPRFSLWLQGYPAEWASCGELAAQSSRKSRRRS